MKMEYQTIVNLLDTTYGSVSRFITEKWVEVHDQPNKIYSINKQIRFKISMLQSDLCDFSDAYIAVEGTVTVEGASNRDRINRSLAFKNNGPFISCISKTNNTLIDNLENLDIAMPMYNLIEYSKNYKRTTGILWNYYRQEPNNPPFNPPVDNNPPTLNYNADHITNSALFKCKSSIIGKAPNNNNDNNTMKVETIMPLKHLINFWRSLDMPLVNFEINLILECSKNCVLTDLITHDAVAAQGNNPARPPINAPTGATFAVTE